MKKYNLIFEDKQGNELKRQLLVGYTKKEALKKASLYKAECMIDSLHKIIVKPSFINI